MCDTAPRTTTKSCTTARVHSVREGTGDGPLSRRLKLSVRDRVPRPSGASNVTASQLDNRTVRLSERSAFWRQGVEDMFHVDSETTQVDDQALETVLQRHDIGHLAVVTLRGSAQQVVVRDWSRARAAHVLIPQTSGGFIETSGVRQTLQAGRVYLVNARGPVLIQTTDRFEHLVLFLPLASSELARMFIANRDADSLILNGGTAATLASALRALLENAPAVVATSEKMVARSITDLFHATLMEAVEALDVSVQMLEVSHRERIRQHVHAALGNPNLSVESIAAEVGSVPVRPFPVTTGYVFPA